MTYQQKKLEIQKLREAGCSYGVIAKKLNISKSTVATICKAIENGEICCLECGKKLTQPNLGRKRKYCSDKCRYDYNRKLGKKVVEISYEKICQCCKKPFKTFKSYNRKYCSWDCYLKGRYGGESYARK